MWLIIIKIIFSMIALWVGSGIAVASVTKIAHSLRISSFVISFFVLGLFTSLTEISVGVNAVIEGTPEVFVGNLIGSSVVVFMLVIPLLAVIGNGVTLNHSFRYRNLVSAAIVVGIPAILTLDNSFSLIDSLICLIIYGYFVYMQERNSNYLDRLTVINLGRSSSLYWQMTKILGAIVVVFFASHVLVIEIPLLGAYWGISPFIISLLGLSVGTNIPELSIALRSVIANKKEVALGNYLGSASLNTFELGILSLISKRPIKADGSNYSILMFIVGLGMFLYFWKSRRNISRIEGLGMLIIYLAFVLLEIFTGPGWSMLGR